MHTPPQKKKDHEVSSTSVEKKTFMALVYIGSWVIEYWVIGCPATKCQPQATAEPRLRFFQDDPVVEEVHLLDPCLDSFLFSEDILKVETVRLPDEESKCPPAPILPCLPSGCRHSLRTWFLPD